jgi:adenine-specific DNA-methyltransferase
MARAWSLTVHERQRQQAAWAFIKIAIDEYISVYSRASSGQLHVTPPAIALGYALDKAVIELARIVGREAAELPIEQACYQLSATYTALVPNGMRGALGMYYTPPALTDRLLEMAQEAGVDWRSARVLDPACGGGAFLLPVAQRIRRAIDGASPQQQLKAIRSYAASRSIPLPPGLRRHG